MALWPVDRVLRLLDRLSVPKDVPEAGPPLSADEMDRIIDDYFANYGYLARGEEQHTPDRIEASASAVNDMAREDPERLWPILTELIDRTRDEGLHYFVAAGPLEDLVTHHGERFLDRLEARAIASERFHAALRGVWGWERFPRDVRKRLFAVLTPEWSELNSAERRA